MNINRDQMELSFEAKPRRACVPARALAPRPRRFGVARWWFNRMREAVCAAEVWPQTSATWGPAEQIPLPLHERG
jgi:hypothetical protein